MKCKSNAIKHAQSYTKLYKVWGGMKSRCNNPNDIHYHDYGARGVKLIEEWAEFMPFYDWAINSGYKDGLTIERIDNNGNYEPLNCQWVSMKQQANNKRNNHLITYRGKTQTLSQWAEECEIKRTTLQMRLSRGWSTDRALSRQKGVMKIV